MYTVERKTVNFNKSAIFSVLLTVTFWIGKFLRSKFFILKELFGDNTSSDISLTKVEEEVDPKVCNFVMQYTACSRFVCNTVYRMLPHVILEGLLNKMEEMKLSG